LLVLQGSCIKNAANSPTGGLTMPEGKYFFLRSIENIHIFNKTGKGAAVLTGNQCKNFLSITMFSIVNFSLLILITFYHSAISVLLKYLFTQAA